MRIFKRALKVIGVIVALAIVAGIVLALINMNTIMLMFGKGKLKVNDVSQVEKAVKSGIVYTVTDSSSSGSNQTIHVVSKDKAVTMQVTQTGSNETITGTVDKSKLPAVDKSDLGAVKAEAEGYLSPFLTEDQIVGIGGYIAKQDLTGGDINISNSYGGAQFNVTKDEGGDISFKIVTDTGSK